MSTSKDPIMLKYILNLRTGKRQSFEDDDSTLAFFFFGTICTMDSIICYKIISPAFRSLPGIATYNVVNTEGTIAAIRNEE